jgi:hypothetical protein
MFLENKKPLKLAFKRESGFPTNPLCLLVYPVNPFLDRLPPPPERPAAPLIPKVATPPLTAYRDDPQISDHDMLLQQRQTMQGGPCALSCFPIVLTFVSQTRILTWNPSHSPLDDNITYPFR